MTHTITVDGTGSTLQHTIKCPLGLTLVTTEPTPFCPACGEVIDEELRVRRIRNEFRTQLLEVKHYLDQAFKASETSLTKETFSHLNDAWANLTELYRQVDEGEIKF